MKRAIIVAFGAIIGTGIATRLSHRIREQMSHKMREHCKQMATGFESRQEPVGKI